MNPKYSLATAVTVLLALIAVAAGLYFNFVLGLPNMRQAWVIYFCIWYSIFTIYAFLAGKTIYIVGAIFEPGGNVYLRRFVAALATGLYLICIRFFVRGF